jgi:hypothetical protein
MTKNSFRFQAPRFKFRYRRLSTSPPTVKPLRGFIVSTLSRFFPAGLKRALLRVVLPQKLSHPPHKCVQTRRACESPAEIRELAGIAFLEATHGVTEAPVPLRPIHRKIAYLIRMNWCKGAVSARQSRSTQGTPDATPRASGVISKTRWRVAFCSG